MRIFANFFLLLFFILANSHFLFSQSMFQGHIFFEDQRTKPLENVRVSIWSNNYIKNSSSNINGNFKIELDVDFNPPFYILCYKVGFYTRIYYLTGQSLSQEIGMKIFIIPPDSAFINTTFVCGRLIQSDLTPVPFVEVFGDYGERPVVSDEQGHFKLPILLLKDRNETYLWFEKEGFNPLIYQVSDAPRYDENNPLTITLEPSPNSYNFDFTVYRSDTEDPIENVTIEIDDEGVGHTDAQGKFLINQRFDQDKESATIKFHHNLFSDTKLSINLSSFWISRVVKLRPPLFKINALVYFESTHQTLEGIPDVEFKLGNILINRTNSLGQSNLSFEALPGDKLSIKFPEDKGYFPPDTSIILSKGQNSLHINAYREPVAINLTAIDSLSGEEVTEIDSVDLMMNNYSVKAKKIDGKFNIITNFFDPDRELGLKVISREYENVDKSIKIKRIDENVYQGLFYVKPKEKYHNAEYQKEEYGEGTLIVDSQPREARIYVDNIEGNYTPDTLTLFKGIHSVLLKKEGYVSTPIIVDIKPDSIINKNLVLEGPIAPLQKISDWLKISTDLTFLSLIMKYPRGNIYPFPTFRVGGNFFPIFNPDCGLKISYLASKIPSYYTSQEFELGLFLGKKRFHWLIGIKESNFESFKKIDSRFAGSSALSHLTFCFDSEDKAKERLLFINQYSTAIIFGYERSFESMNKSVTGKFKEEQELFGGFMRRWKRGIVTVRFGVINPKLTVVDIEEKPPKNIDIRISRLFISYNYFLN
jgi:hypothetical protein